MENAADALKIAFGLLVFAIALTVIFTMVAKVKSTADVVLYYSDNTNFYEHTSSKDKNRIVKVADVVATLYRYYKESVAVTIVLEKNNPNETYYFDMGNERMGNQVLLITDGNGNELLKLGTEKNIEKNLGEFILSRLINNASNANAEFMEEFTEIPTGGIYLTGTDGTEITLSAEGKKVYITYTKI